MANQKFLDGSGLQLYDQLNKEQLAEHTDNADIHIDSGQKSKINSAYDHAQSAHAPSSAEKNIIIAIKKNGTALTPDSSRSVNITVPTKVSELTNDSSFVSTSTVNSSISSHNTNTSAHSDIRDLISTINTRLNTVLDSDDTTLDQLSEIVSYIKSNKSLIESVTTTKLNVSDVINNLTTNSSSKALSASMGVTIKALIDALQSELDSLETTVGNKADKTHTHNYAGSSSPGGDATNALKLQGKSLNSQTTAWNGIAHVKDDGVLEVGKYIDFHATSESGTNYDARITATTSGLTLSGTTIGTFQGNLSGKSTTSGTADKVANSLSINGKSFNGSSAVDVGTLGVAYGGTGMTTANDAANMFLNSLSVGTSDPTGEDYYISQYVGGGTTTTTYHRRPISNLWNYIKSQANSVYALISHNHSASQITSGTLAIARGGTGASATYGAQYNLLNDMHMSTSTMSDTTQFVFKYVSPDTAQGTLYYRTGNYVWDYINSKIAGAASTITTSNLTASRALISNSSGKVAVSSVTSTELGYLAGVTSNIQTQLNGKAATSHGTHVTYSSTVPLMDGTASVGSASTVARSDHRHPTDYTRLPSWNGGRVYRYSFGGSQDLTWKKIFSCSDTTTAPTSATYHGCTVYGKIHHALGNHNQAQVRTWDFQVSFLTLSNLSVSNTATLYLPPTLKNAEADIIRVVRVSTNSFEIQVRQPADWQVITVEFSYNNSSIPNVSACSPTAVTNTTVIQNYQTHSVLTAQNYALASSLSNYVLKSGSTMTGTLVINKSTDADLYTATSPALIVGGLESAAHIAIDNNEICAKGSGTTAATLYLNSLTYVNANGTLSTPQLTISSTSAVSHLAFSRAGFNYITTPSSGTLAFVMNGQAVGSATSSMIISSTNVYPGTANTISLGTTTYKWASVYATTFYGALSGNATTASQAYVTTTNPSSGTTYYPTFVSSTGGTTYALRANNGIKYYTYEGTTSAVGAAQLGLGNNIASGTAGNKTGAIYIYGNSSGYTQINPSNHTTSNINIYLPSGGGTLARTADNVASANRLYMQTSATSCTSTGLYVISAGGATVGNTVNYSVDTPNSYSSSVQYGTILRVKYNNSSVYYTDIWVDTNANNIYYKTVSNGTSHGWTRILTKDNVSSYALPLACSASTPLTGVLYFKTNSWAGDIVGANASAQRRWELYSNSSSGAVADTILRVYNNTDGTTYATYTFGTNGTLSLSALSTSGAIAANGGITVASGKQVTINTSIATHAQPTNQCLVINSTTTPSGTTLGLANAPGIGFHIANVAWANMIYDGAFKFVNSSFNGYVSVYASTFYGNLSGNATSATGVTQGATSTASYRALLMGTSYNADATQLGTSETGQLYKVTSIYAQPSTGTIFSTSLVSNTWRSSTYGGGWYMSDTSWIRTYGNKSIYQNSGTLRTDGTLQVGSGGSYFSASSSGVTMGVATTISNQLVVNYDSGYGLVINSSASSSGIAMKRTDSGNQFRIGIGADGNHFGIYSVTAGYWMLHGYFDDGNFTTGLGGRLQVGTGAYGTAAPPTTGTLRKGMVYFQIIS